ncbi:dihydrofolate reductase family protein [Cellulomonas marina]|uniref:Pyrimidine reductase, riboflavin biosynthesis n=1 Tax=Cellulomonas marina TaxID=988821 RepID=A0A1I0W520_9CELL|nr:dihydrofolate reductase family protein [Cellulomonas marina]SFA83330.1 Pyrimidine reductase, riboflavin biosynthesis [Cellulomonas marina]
MSEPPALDVLLPADLAGTRLGPDPTEAALRALWTRPPGPGTGAHPEGPWVRAVMIGTLDGAAAGPDGRTGSINDAADHRVFTTLRALSDVVLVGVGTARDEGYPGALDLPEALVAARGADGFAPGLPLAVVTRSGQLSDALLAGDARPYVVTHAGCPRLDALRTEVGAERLLVHGDDDVDLRGAVAALAAAGLPRIALEGGPSLLARMVTLGLVDELSLTLSPQLVGGDAPRMLAGVPFLDPVVPGRLVHLLHADGVLLARYALGRVEG